MSGTCHAPGALCSTPIECEGKSTCLSKVRAEPKTPMQCPQCACPYFAPALQVVDGKPQIKIDESRWVCCQCQAVILHTPKDGAVVERRGRSQLIV